MDNQNLAYKKKFTLDDVLTRYSKYLGGPEYSVAIDKLMGQIIFDISYDSETLIIRASNGLYFFYHSQECCETVWLDDITGDLSDLIGRPILVAECRTGELEDGGDGEYTFYQLGTVTGRVDFRFVGISHYYSVGIDIDCYPSII